MSLPNLPKKGVVISLLFNLALLTIVGFAGYKIASAHDVVLVKKENAEIVNFCNSHPEVCGDAKEHYFSNVNSPLFRILNSGNQEVQGK